jgi:Protein of unknown function (DUF1493)
MELTDPIEEAVLEWYKNKWNGISFFSKKPWEMTRDTSLSTGRYPWVWETGEEIMDDYFKTFNVNSENFDLLKYWPDEPGWIPHFLLPKSMRIKYVEPEPLTIGMLIESAKAGRWLYD